MHSHFIVFVLGVIACVSTDVDAVPRARMEVPSVAFNDLFRPTGDDRSSSEHFRHAMLGDGILTVHDIPGFANLRRRVMAGVAACGATAPAARVTNFPDGTSRRTVAVVTKGFHPLDAVDFDGDPREACSKRLFADVKTFRELVSSVSHAFVERLAELFPSRDGSPLLQTTEQGKFFQDVHSLVAAGDHLEHFHAYYRGERPPLDEDTPSSAGYVETIDLHADQGMFIIFTPGVVVDLSPEPPATVAGESPGSFFVERRDGEIVEVDFSYSDNVLAIMLGDGIDAIINPKMPEGVLLRSTPHAMRMPDLSSGWVRSWYGRMFLPPSSAVHNASTGISYGEMREMAIDSVRAGGGEGSPGLGCSRRALSATDTTCDDPNDMYCWMRCMPKVVCSAAPAGHTLKCASQRDEIWRPEDSHGDYNPTCTNSTANVTADPIMPDRYKNAPSGGCAKTFTAYLAEPDPSGAAWTNQHELIKDKLYLQWRRCTSTPGAVEMRMAYDGSFGYLALGLENPGGGHNGMNGARTVMGIYDPDEKAHGGESWLNFVGTGVKELKIHDTLSAFRHWKDSAPNTPGLIDSSMDVNPGCGSAMYFKTKTIHGIDLNMTKCSPNKFIWAIHTSTLLKGYHGWGNRGHLKIDFAVDSGIVPWVSPYSTSPSTAGLECETSHAVPCAQGFLSMLLMTVICFLL